MALTQAFRSGVEIGMAGGGRLSGIGTALKGIAEDLRSERLFRRELEGKKALLGEAARVEASYKPTTQAIVGRTGEILGTRPVGSVFAPKEEELSTREILGALNIVPEGQQKQAAEALTATFPDLRKKIETERKSLFRARALERAPTYFQSKLSAKPGFFGQDVNKKKREVTLQIIDQIKAVGVDAGLKELIKRRSEAEKKGIDVQGIINFFGG